MDVRHGTESDLERLAELFDGYRQFYRRDADLPGARAFITDRLAQGDSVLLVAEDDGQVVGFTQLYRVLTSVGLGFYWLLNDLFVDPDARGDGAATALLRAAEAHGRATGAQRLSLKTEWTNAPARALYEREGWVRDEAFASYDRPLLF